ncbi:hypothetical protein AAHB62_01005 [Bacillus cereus]
MGAAQELLSYIPVKKWYLAEREKMQY